MLKSQFSNLNKDNKDTYIPDINKYANAHFYRGNYHEAIPYYELMSVLFLNNQLDGIIWEMLT